MESDEKRGKDRLRTELDFLSAAGISNLRVMVGAEGSGMINGVQRVSPPLQPQKGVFNVKNLGALDLLLSEMGKRKMTAVLFFSNNWEWSGGFLQYLNWNGRIPDSTVQRKLSWDEMRDNVSAFYTCKPCTDDYKKAVSIVLARTNSVTGKRYSEDPTILAWELANEPRPMRPASNAAYKVWIRDVAAYIKSRDRNHMVTIGHEGEMGTESISLYEQIHADKNVDYLTIHIWPKNWSWFREASMEQDMPQVLANTEAYIKKHLAVARKLSKPLVLEEFGLPRDGHSFDPEAGTLLRDTYFKHVFSFLKASASAGGPIAGANFWAFGGIARPVAGQVFWKGGDAYMGDPPMEEQGLNTVFDRDESTWKLIKEVSRSLRTAPLPARPKLPQKR
jgi:mannan endo-1,4-beta-mannosidase